MDLSWRPPPKLIKPAGKGRQRHPRPRIEPRFIFWGSHRGAPYYSIEQALAPVGASLALLRVGLQSKVTNFMTQGSSGIVIDCFLEKSSRQCIEPFLLVLTYEKSAFRRGSLQQDPLCAVVSGSGTTAGEYEALRDPLTECWASPRILLPYVVTPSSRRGCGAAEAAVRHPTRRAGTRSARGPWSAGSSLA